MPELPSGRLTFLFTDIECSTERWERDLKAMAVRSGARWRSTAATIALDNVAAVSAAETGEAGERMTPVRTSITRQRTGEGHDDRRAPPSNQGAGHWREEREDELTRATVPRLTAPAWARCGGSPAAASARAPRSRRRPACP